MSHEDMTAQEDRDQEISALVETLQKIGRRLEELTDGQVDTIVDTDGRTLFLLGTQEQLKHSEIATQAAILNALPSNIALLNSNGIIIEANSAWRKFAYLNARQFGPGHPVGTNYLEICDMATGDDAVQSRLAAAGIRSLLAGGSKYFSMEYEFHSSGEQHYFLMTAIPLAEDSHKGVIVRQFDITSQKQATAKLLSLTERLSLATHVAGIGVWEWDLASNTLTWDATMFSIYGLPQIVQVPYAQWSAAVHPDDLEDREVALLKVVGKKTEGTGEFRIVLPDGSGKVISAAEKAVLDDHGNVIRVVGVNLDITERIALQRQLQQSQKMDALGQLTGGIAHDFNNLLAVIIGNLDLLERQVSGDESALKYVLTAQKAASRSADLTRRLLAFSSNEILSPVSTNLSHLIRNVVEMAHRVIGPEIKVVTSFEESIAKILVDASGLESALLNLMVNARDAMHSAGTITISTQSCNLEQSYPPVKSGEIKAGNYACISVSDTGEGMSKRTLERVFEPFFTTKPRGKGTGLGLAMVYGFVKQSHGTIRIYSELGHGTTVTLYLPLTEDASLPVAEVIEPWSTFSGTGAVLVVDDEIELLDIATAYLEAIGCKALSAMDGDDALRIIEREKNIDLMITDIIMPGGMNGVELARKVRQLNPRIRIIYCSGFPADTLTERGMPVVDGPLLRKPYQRDEFCTLVRIVIQAEPVRSKETGSRDTEAPPI